MKITITQDKVDCGDRKIVEEIQLRKYDDFEQFSFSECVKKLRGNLDDGISLRVHLINDFQFVDKSDLMHREQNRAQIEAEMEEA